MFKTLFYKEILDNIMSRRFFIVCVLCLIVIPLGTYVSTKDYQSRLQNYQEAVRLYEEGSKKIQDILFKGGAKGFRSPSHLSFLSLGLEVVLPNVAETQGRYGTPPPIEMRLSNNRSLDNLYELFHGPLDLVFIVSVVMTFLAIVFSYGSVSGEKELGTLKQILCNSVPRYQVILAKIGANFLVLIIPFLIALLLSMIIFQTANITVFGPNGAWLYILLAVIFSLLLIGAFFNLGVLISTLTKQAVSTIVILLLCWVFLFGIFPRLSVILSRLVYPVKLHQLITLEKNQVRLDNERECKAEIDRLIESTPEKRRPSPEEYKEMGEKQQTVREEFRAKLVEKLQKIDRDVEKKRNTQMSIATNFARLSPVSCFIKPLAEVSHTGWNEYQRFKEKISQFQQVLNKEVFYKQRRTRYRRSVGSHFAGDMTAPAPKFEYSRIPFENIVRNILPDFILLVIFNILFFTGAFVGFLRYDAR